MSTLSERPIIEVDVETSGLQWYAHKLFLVQFNDGERTEVLKHPQDKEFIQDWLNADADFRAWNSKFDLHFLEASGYTLPPQERWHDGMVLAHIIDERWSVGLQNRADKLLGDDAAGRVTEKEVKEWLAIETKLRRAEAKENKTELIRPNYSDVPDEIMFPYAEHDVVVQRQVCEIYEDKLAPELRPVYELEQGVLGALFDVEKLGINMDKPGAEMLAAELEADLDRLTDEAVELSGDPDFNPRSGIQVGEALTRRGADLTFAKKLKNGSPSVDAESLEAIDDELATKISEVRQTQKVYKTYVYPLLNSVEDSYGTRYPFIADDGRLHADLRQVGARTARMSSSPNVQNWPRDDLRMRHLAVARPGYKLVAVDLDSVELRLFAAFIGEGKLLEMMRDPEADLHAYTAKMIGLKDRDRGGGVVEPARQRGKKFNYERIYGGGVRAIRRFHGVSQNVGTEMLWKWRETFPEAVEFQNRIEFALYDVGYVKTPWGRRHRADHPKFADRESYKFVNYIIQGTGADLFKESVVRVHRMGIPMVALTHDEILAEVKTGKADWAAEEIRTALIDHPAITNIIPLDAEAKIVDRWSHAKSPDFVPAYEMDSA